MPYYVSIDTCYTSRNYKSCEVVRKLGEDEAPIDEIMYEIEFEDGVHIDAFDDELWDGVKWKP
jgi:hypothetical protein